MSTTDTPTIRRIGATWYVITDGSSVGFARKYEATDYAATLTAEQVTS